MKPKIAKISKLPIPIELIAVVGGTLLARLLKMEETWNIIPVGHIPVGLPEAILPKFGLWKELLVDSFAIAFVSYSVTVSMALIFGQKLKYEIDFNQELLAMVKVQYSVTFFSNKFLILGHWQHSGIFFLLHAFFCLTFTDFDTRNSWRKNSTSFSDFMHAIAFCSFVDRTVL